MAEEQGPILAATDIGSNTVHQVIVRGGSGVTELTVIERRVELLRLGADIAATGAISAARAAQVEGVLAAMAARATELGATVRLGLATEGVRAASNAAALIARFSAAYGTAIALISGLEEAALSFWGALSDVADVAGPMAVADLGGGSCELVVGTANQLAFAHSLPLGSGRLIDTVHPADPPTDADFARLRTVAETLLAAVPVPNIQPAQLLAVGGTAASLTRLSHGDDLARLLTLADLQRIRVQLGKQPLDLTAHQARLDPARVRLLVGGVVAWEAIVRWLGVAALHVSHRGVREGAIIAWRQAGADWQSFAARAVPPAAR